VAKKDEGDMGLSPIIEILPETWQNIPWTL
jgi:hypothetical protein